ncbi:MAG: entericidin A/B family lipoprotein [Proteobacteria bacterium]|nr:entericidin A/B family lipoprotein [Pseudomonadota bacterium]
MALRIAFSSLWILAAATCLPLLTACNTTAGAGKDISATGNAITESAQKHTP